MFTESKFTEVGSTFFKVMVSELPAELRAKNISESILEVMEYLEKRYDAIFVQYLFIATPVYGFAENPNCFIMRHKKEGNSIKFLDKQE